MLMDVDLGYNSCSFMLCTLVIMYSYSFCLYPLRLIFFESNYCCTLNIPYLQCMFSSL